MRWRYFSKIGAINCCKHTCRLPKACRTLCIVFVGTNVLALVHIYFFGYFHLSSKWPHSFSTDDDDSGVIVEPAELQSSHETFNPATQVPLLEIGETDDFAGIATNNVTATESTNNVTSVQPLSQVIQRDNEDIFVEKYDDKGFCNVPRTKAFHRSVARYFRKQYPPGVVPCRPQKRYPHIFTTDLTTKLIEIKSPRDHNLTDCCYGPLLGADEGSKRKKKGEKPISPPAPCYPISQTETVIPQSLEFIQIKCNNLSERNPARRTVTVDMFAFARLKPETKKRMEKLKAEDGENVTRKIDRLNVIIFGFDGTSAMNFQRIMPKTHRFLMENLKGFRFKGYSKTGDNTYPNLAPMFFGLNTTELETKYWKGKSKFYDYTPLPWKKFADMGYATSFIEDSAWMGMFNYGKRGFKVPPVDFYAARPFMLRASRDIGNHRVMNSKICYGSRLSIEVIHDYMKKVAKAVGVDKRFFQLTWACALGHDNMNLGYLGDDSVLKTLKWYQENGFLENSAVIFLSDHGSRYGGIRNMIQGRLEERMPVLYLAFPSWFHQKYHSAVSNMQSNEDRLTSHYDFFETLTDLADMHQITDLAIRTRTQSLKARMGQNGPPRGISLFLPIPAKRTCAQAGIPTVYCVCFHKRPAKVSSRHIQAAVEQGILMLNRHLKAYGKGKCEPIALREIVSAEFIDLEYQHVKQGWRSNASRTYSISFRVDPDNAFVEGKFWRELPYGKWSLVDVLTRLDNGTYYNKGCLQRQSETAKTMCKCKSFTSHEDS